MSYERVPMALASTLGLLAGVLAVVAIVAEPGLLVLAVPFAIAAGLVYYHASGRLAARVYRRVHRAADVSDRAVPGSGAADFRRGPAGSDVDGPAGAGGRFRREGPAGMGGPGADAGPRTDAGPRDGWRPPRGGRTVREAAAEGVAGGARTDRGPAGTGETGGRRAGRRPAGADRPPTAEDYRTLGLEPGADRSAVEAAYRERVKEVHPDAAEGDREQFLAVKRAYERLTE